MFFCKVLSFDLRLHTNLPFPLNLKAIDLVPEEQAMRRFASGGGDRMERDRGDPGSKEARACSFEASGVERVEGRGCPKIGLFKGKPAS